MERTPTMWVGDEITVFAPNPNYTFGTPGNAAEGGLGAFLDRVAKVVTEPSGTVIIGDSIPLQLGFQRGKAPTWSTPRINTEPLNSARKHGWTISKERPWMVCTRREQDHRGRRYNRTVYLGIAHWLEPKKCTLIDRDPATMIARMHWWYRLVGLPYYGEHPGVAAVAVLRDGYNGKRTPYWTPVFDGIDPAEKATEVPCVWQASPDADRLPYEHGYDVTALHLAAAGTVQLAVDRLTYRGAGLQLVSENPPGYYRITVPEWRFYDRMPHPAGRYFPGDTVWVAHPTVDMLFEVAHEYGVIAEPEVHEAWTCDISNRVMRDFSRWFSEGLKLAAGFEDLAVYDALKEGYKKGIGMLNMRPNPKEPDHKGRVFRPDWEHAIIAKSRCDVWRKLWKEGNTSGRWPVEVTENDLVYYGSDDPDPAADASWPVTFKKSEITEHDGRRVATGPGSWKAQPNKTRQVVSHD